MAIIGSVITENMSDAEATIRHSILLGMASSSRGGENIDTQQAVDIIFEELFVQDKLWAVKSYLHEIEPGPDSMTNDQ